VACARALHNKTEDGMAEISNLGYLVFGVSDLPAWKGFAVDILGMQLNDAGDEHTTSLRMDAYAQRIVLEQTGEDDITAAGWLFDTEEELAAFVARAPTIGLSLTAGSAAQAKARNVEKVYISTDPSGVRHEFAFGPTLAPIASPFKSGVLLGNFKTDALGVGHALLVAKDYAESVAYYRNGIGLRLSDYIRQEIAPGVVIDATFFHSKTGRHHSLATTFIPGASKRLNHFMIEVDNMDDVGLAFDRCVKNNVPVFMGIGHHPNDHMVSFYVLTPSGFAVEFGYGGLVIDDSNWEVRNYSQLSDWGHHRGAAFKL
jgi:2,3-dihydroxybiphenyl 1,2-dioxygenase